MTSDPIVTIVVPTRNRCRWLQETVASVLAQTFSRWELIVVDDASEDETRTWLQQLDDPRIKSLRLESCSERARARNTGLEVARGQFILFLDDDDLLTEEALHVHLDALKQAPTAIASVGGYIMFDPAGSRWSVPLVRRRTVRRIWSDILFMSSPPVSGQSLFRTQAVKMVNGWDGRFIPIEDHDLWLRIGRLGPVVLLPEIVLQYRVHSGQWRPRALNQMMDQVRQQAVARLQGRERQRAERLFQARALAQTAFERYGHVEAFILYLKSLRLAPGLLRSPLARPLVVTPLMRMLVGKLSRRLERALFSQRRPILERTLPPRT